MNLYRWLAVLTLTVVAGPAFAEDCVQWDPNTWCGQQLLVAAQSDPNDPRAYVFLADTYGWLGIDAESKQAAQRAKQLDPNAFEILR